VTLSWRDDPSQEHQDSISAVPNDILMTHARGVYSYNRLRNTLAQLKWTLLEDQNEGAGR
jgi:hypothetical protein